MTLQALRTSLQSAIASSSTYSVFDHVPENVTTPCIMIMTGDPWLEPAVMGNNKAWRVHYVLELAVSSMSNPGALVNLETMVATVLPLIPKTWQITNVSSPRIRQANTAEAYSVEVSINTIYNP